MKKRRLAGNTDIAFVSEEQATSSNVPQAAAQLSQYLKMKVVIGRELWSSIGHDSLITWQTHIVPIATLAQPVMP